MLIHCCECQQKIEARLTDGREIYPHRSDLFDLPFWKCDTCGNFVGCHHKTKNRTQPLGVIPTPELKNARQHIHRVLDPMWQGKGKGERNRLYNIISHKIGWEYHTAKLKTIEEARAVYVIVKKLQRGELP